VPEHRLYFGYESPSIAVGGTRYVPGSTFGREVGAVCPGTPRPATARVPGPSHAVIIRRRALLAAVAVAMLVMLALPWGGTGGRSLATPGAARAGSLVAGTYYVVRPGDTLWGIADRLADGSDPRPLVAQLEVEAGGDALQPGEVLHLP
jgi:hypothetical protein